MAKSTPKASPAPVAYRIWFVAEPATPGSTNPAPPPTPDAAPEKAAVLRRFTDPYPAVAMRETRPLDLTLAGPEKPAAAAPELWVIGLPTGVSESQAQAAHRWLHGPAGPQPITAESEGVRLLWRPGQALIAADPEPLDAALAGLADFAFYENQLHQLEDEVALRWGEVTTDLPYISKIDAGTKHVWPALYEKLEHQHQLGMLSTRIEHRVALLTHDRPPEVRQLLSRLLARARVKTRLEQLNNHLEVRDGVYDQIGYRLADHRQLRASLVIEVVIVVLLLMEVGISLYNLLHGAA